MKIGIFGNNFQSDQQNLIKRIFEYLHSFGAEILVEKSFYEYLSEELDFSPEIRGIIPEMYPDVAISIGGDGTFLHTVAFIQDRNIPIMGINTGRLGFLADTGIFEIEKAIGSLFRKDYRIEERSLLQMNTIGEDYPVTFALNEIAVQKRDTSSMISIETHINGEYLTTYAADGLVVATPTGSTAYSMSVNGPIIVPQAENVVLSPIAPHSLNVRPLVIPDSFVLDLKVKTRGDNFLVSSDGHSEVFPSEMQFHIRKAGFTVKLIKSADHTFYRTLREKLMWGADARN